MSECIELCVLCDFVRMSELYVVCKHCICVTVYCVLCVLNVCVTVCCVYCICVTVYIVCV